LTVPAIGLGVLRNKEKSPGIPGLFSDFIQLSKNIYCSSVKISTARQ